MCHKQRAGVGRLCLEHERRYSEENRVAVQRQKAKKEAKQAKKAQANAIVTAEVIEVVHPPPVVVAPVAVPVTVPVAVPKVTRPRTGPTIMPPPTKKKRKKKKVDVPVVISEEAIVATVPVLVGSYTINPKPAPVKKKNEKEITFGQDTVIVVERVGNKRGVTSRVTRQQTKELGEFLQEQQQQLSATKTAEQ